jgi:hypothetical protein
MRRRKTVQVPRDGAGVTKRTREVFALSVGRGDEPDTPEGRVQLGVDEHGRPLYGHSGRESELVLQGCRGHARPFWAAVNC